MSNVSFSYFLWMLLFVPFSLSDPLLSILRWRVLSPHLVLSSSLFSNCPRARGTERQTGRRLHRSCRYVIYYLAPSWLAYLDGEGEEGNKRHFTHGTQSKRTAKERGGWHCVHTWVIDFYIYIYKVRKRWGEVTFIRLSSGQLPLLLFFSSLTFKIEGHILRSA